MLVFSIYLILHLSLNFLFLSDELLLRRRNL